MEKYSIGIDFGTLCARAVLVRVSDGAVVATSSHSYPHGIMTAESFGERCALDTAYQHPLDYIEALRSTVSGVLLESGAGEDSIVGVGIDFTSCTSLPVKRDGTPLCTLPEFKDCAEAYVKLWKHHGAERQAERINGVAMRTYPEMLARYGGRISSEWLLPKLLETLDNAPHVLDETDYYLEAADWLVLLLTGRNVRSSATVGYKALWDAEAGFPDNSFFYEIDPRLDGVIGTVISEDVLPVGTLGGRVTPEGASISGLPVGCPVAMPIIDAHSTALATGKVRGGVLTMILGTSACHILLSDSSRNVEGIAGRVLGGVVEDLYAYEAGQSCFGDTFGWFASNMLPSEYTERAKDEGVDVFTYLNRLAQENSTSGNVLVLDWLGGNRTPYDDPSLSGMILGLTLSTRPEDIYRGIVTSLAFGTRRIVELYERSGLEISEIVAAGGISSKNPYLMQSLADVLKRDIHVLKTKEASALGAAVLGAAVCGEMSIRDAAERFFAGYSAHYHPNAEKYESLDALYSEYLSESEHYAKKTSVMRKLRNL